MAAETAIRRIVLAYSGGLDTSVILRWLGERYGAEVIAFCADVGQGAELAGLSERARQTGATKAIVEDLREEFAKDYVFPMLRAGAIYENQYLLGTSIARPLIARRQVEIARQEGADAVAHGATGKGNDQVRFELTYAALAPELRIVAPWREWEFRGRRDLIAYAEAQRIPITVTAEKPYSTDRNLLHVSYEGGVLEDPWRAPYEDMFQLTVAPERAPDRAEEIDVELEAGVPVAVTGEHLSPAALLARLNTVAGAHGIGRADVVENRYVGMKSRGVVDEAPGAAADKKHEGVGGTPPLPRRSGSGSLHDVASRRSRALSPRRRGQPGARARARAGQAALAAGGRPDRARAGGHPPRARARPLPFSCLRRGHPHGHRAASRRAARPARRQAPHRTEPQRSGRTRPPPLAPRPVH